MLILELLNNILYLVPEEAPLNILQSKYDMCMDKNSKNNNYTSNIARRLHLVRNGEN